MSAYGAHDTLSSTPNIHFPPVAVTLSSASIHPPTHPPSIVSLTLLTTLMNDPPRLTMHPQRSLQSTYPPAVRPLKPLPDLDFPPPSSQPRPRSPSPPWQDEQSVGLDMAHLLPHFPDGSHLFDGLDPAMELHVAQKVQDADTFDNWRRRLSSSPSPNPFRRELLEDSPPPSNRPWIVLSSDSSSEGDGLSSCVPSLAQRSDVFDTPFPPFPPFSEPALRSRRGSLASDISEGTRALEETVMDYSGSASQPAPSHSPPTARHVLFDDDGQPINDEGRYYIDMVARMLDGRASWDSDSDSEFVPEDSPTPGWTTSSESDEEEPPAVLDEGAPVPSLSAQPLRRKRPDPNPFWGKRWPSTEWPPPHTPSAFLKQCLRLAADRVVEAKDMEHPIFGPFHPEEKVSPPIPEWLVLKQEAEENDAVVMTGENSQEPAAPGQPEDSLRDTELRPSSQSDGTPLHSGSNMLSLVHNSDIDSGPVLLSQSHGKPQVPVEYPQHAAEEQDAQLRLLSQSDGKPNASNSLPLSQSDGKLQLSHVDGQPLVAEHRLPSQRDGKPDDTPILSQADGKPLEGEQALSQGDGKPPLLDTPPTDVPHTEVKLERAATPLWEYPGRPLDSEPNERLITIKSKPYGEMKVLPGTFRHATYKGPLLDDDDYDSDELLELETGNIKDVTAMRPDPLGIMPQKATNAMASGAEEVLRSVLHLARFARPPSTKIARKQMAPLDYESTVQMSAAFLPPSVVMMAELRARRIIESAHGSWCEPGEAVGIASALWGPPRNDFEAASFYVSAEPLVDHDHVSASPKSRPGSKPRPSPDSSPSTSDEENEEQAQVNQWFVNAFRRLARNRKRTYSAHAQMLRRKAKHGHLFKDQLDASSAETGYQTASSAEPGHRQKGAATHIGNTVIPDAVHPSLEEQLFGEDLAQRRMRRSLREMNEVCSLPGVERPPSSDWGRPHRSFSKRHRWDGKTRYPSFDADSNPYLSDMDNADSADDGDDSEEELSSYDGDDDESDGNEGGADSDDRDEKDDAEQGAGYAGSGAGGESDGSDDSDEDGDDSGGGNDSNETDDDDDTEDEDGEVSGESEEDADVVDAAVSGLNRVKVFNKCMLAERKAHVYKTWPEADPEEYDSEVDSGRVPSSSSSHPPPPINAPTQPTATEPANAVAGPSTAPRKRGRPPKNRDEGATSAAAAPAQRQSRAAQPKNADELPKKRGPGRPPKNKAAGAPPPPPPPKKRGRPPKDKGADLAPSSRTEPPPKRRPGRPRKEKGLEPALAAPDTDTGSEPPKKRPGRPRKNKDVEPDVEPATEAAEPPKKRRGRPPKRKDVETDVVPASDTAEPPKKRGPGRPRKSEKDVVPDVVPAADTAEPPKKRGPGRPRKSEKDVGPDVVPAADTAEPPKKRGPGRPRKSEKDVERDVVPAADTAEPPKRRGPGRPRKSDRDVEPDVEPAAEPAADTAEPPEKRGPGRPRKIEKSDPAPTTPKKRGRPPMDKGKGKQRADDNDGDDYDELATPKRLRFAAKEAASTVEDDEVEVIDQPRARPSAPIRRQVMSSIEVPSRVQRPAPPPGFVPFPVRQFIDRIEIPSRGLTRPASSTLPPAQRLADGSGADGSTPATRPRGRPQERPVPESETDDVREQESDEMPPQKRQRGRPLKSTLREQPTSSAVPAAVTESYVSSTSPPVTHRQGPTWATHNGHRAAATSPTPSAADEENVDELQDSQEVPVKRGRGRPKGSKNRPKPPTDEPTTPAKQKPGRPSKSDPKLAGLADDPPEKREPNLPRQTDPGPATADPTADPPAKRKRGRPRKSEPEPQAAAGEDTEKETPAKRGRGRPKGSTNYTSALSQAPTPRVTRATPRTAPGSDAGTARETRSTANEATGSPLARSTRSGGASKAELAAMYPAYSEAESKEDEFYDRMNLGLAGQRVERDGKDDDGSYRPTDDDDDDLFS